MKKLIKNEGLRKFLLVTCLAFVGAIFFSGGKMFTSPKFFGIAIVWSAAIWYSQWYGHGMIEDYLSEKIPWTKHSLKRLLASFFSHVIYAVLAIFVVNFIMEYFVNDHILNPFTKGYLITGSIAVGISIFISIVMTAVAFYYHLNQSLAREEKLKAEMMTYKYESLRTQINPHFLFNSFNVLSDLVYSDQGLAVKFIRQLGDVYRYVLDSRNREMVPLSEELEFIESFAFLLHTRFEDNIKFKNEISAESNELIVPMSLQLLIENAVKHNQVSKAHPLEIRMFKEEGFLVVENDIQLKKIPEESKKVGLENIKNRYDYLSDKAVVVENTTSLFKVRIPILYLSDD